MSNKILTLHCKAVEQSNQKQVQSKQEEGNNTDYSVNKDKD